jgi:hypothetical protein
MCEKSDVRRLCETFVTAVRWKAARHQGDREYFLFMCVFGSGASAALLILMLEVSSSATSSAAHLVSLPVVPLSEPAILVLLGGGLIVLANLIRGRFSV